MYSFTEDFAANDGLLRVTTTGRIAFEELFSFLDRIKQNADENGTTNILVDSSTIEGQLSEAERFEGGKRIAEVFGGRYRVAWVLPAQMITKLGEMAGLNRGALLLVTSSENEAQAWVTPGI